MDSFQLLSATQGKRSDTLGMNANNISINALSTHFTRVSDLGRGGLNQRSPARSGKAKPNERIAQGKRSDTLGMNANNISINALKGQKR